MAENTKPPKIAAIIHARGGSKRIPLKNIQLLKGKPLISYAIGLAKSVPEINRIIVSTDHPEISSIAKSYGAEVPFVRPADISEDVPSEFVTLHAVKWLMENEGYKPDIAVTITPATPYTKTADLRRGIKLLLDHPEWATVATIRKTRDWPQWVVDLHPDGTATTLLGNPLNGEWNVSQNLKRYYYLMGAFWLNRVDPFLKDPSMYTAPWGAIELDVNESIDIDEPHDLKEAEAMNVKI